MGEKKPLKINIPENLGVPSEAIRNFIDDIETQKLCLHSFMILRHGEIAAEGYYPPFDSGRLHRMYSTSKTFVSMAIGMLIDEGKITLDDKIADFFPEYLPDDPHPYIMETTVKDLLMMATPYTWNTYGRDDKNWVWTFLNRTPSHPPGTVFSYDTSGTVMLNGIVEKVSGKPLLDYMRPKLLDPIGFSDCAAAIERPEGGAWGGSGVLCSTHDLAKFALMLLNKGRYNGEQLISEKYVSEATSAMIDNRATNTETEFQFGYGYQVWRTRNNGFATLGMGCQISVCLPDKDLVFLTTGDTQGVTDGLEKVLRSFWVCVYPYLSDGKLEENRLEYDKLTDKLNNLEFIKVDGMTESAGTHLYNGKTYKLYDNPMSITEIKFVFDGAKNKMCYRNATGYHEIEFGTGCYICGEFPENHYFGRKIGVKKEKGYEYKASAAWFDDKSFIIYVYAIDDYFGTLKISAAFKDDKISIHMAKVAEWFFDEYSGFAAGYLIENE